MKKIISLNGFLAILLFLFLMPSSFAQNKNVPWKSLFNGENLDGWKMVGEKGVAYVQDGEILIHRTKDTKEHAFLATKKKYSDFILEVDFKMDAPGFSTGVLIRCIDANSNPDTSRVSLYGYQIKIDNTPRNWTGGIFDDFGGSWKWMYDLSQNDKARQAFKLSGWNTFRIEAIGNSIKVWLNGVPSTNLVNGKYTKGYIAFKMHSLNGEGKGEETLLHFKNIRIITKNPALYSQTMDIKEISVK